MESFFISNHVHYQVAKVILVFSRLRVNSLASEPAFPLMSRVGTLICVDHKVQLHHENNPLAPIGWVPVGDHFHVHGSVDATGLLPGLPGALLSPKVGLRLCSLARCCLRPCLCWGLLCAGSFAQLPRAPSHLLLSCALSVVVCDASILHVGRTTSVPGPAAQALRPRRLSSAGFWGLQSEVVFTWLVYS